MPSDDSQATKEKSADGSPGNPGNSKRTKRYRSKAFDGMANDAVEMRRVANAAADRMREEQFRAMKAVADYVNHGVMESLGFVLEPDENDRVRQIDGGHQAGILAANTEKASIATDTDEAVPNDEATSQLCLIGESAEHKAQILRSYPDSRSLAAAIDAPKQNTEDQANHDPKLRAAVMQKENVNAGITRARAVKAVHEELANIRPRMYSGADYEPLKNEFPRYVAFEICDRHPDLKLKLENIQGHQQFKRFAIEIVAAKYQRKFYTIQKDWKKYNPDKKRRH